MPESRNTNKLIIKVVSNTKFDAFFIDNRNKVFKNNITVNFNNLYSNNEKEKLIKRDKEFSKQRLNYFFILNNEIIGWSFGKIIDYETFYMINSAMFKDFQNKGYYSQFLIFLIKDLKMKGFQIITSKHHASNSQVLIPKLKNNFVITGVDFMDKFGFLITLTHFINSKRKKIFDHRIGFERFNDFNKYI